MTTKMNKFFMGITNIVVNEYKSSMIISIMGISFLMVHAEQIEDTSLNKLVES